MSSVPTPRQSRAVETPVVRQRIGAYVVCRRGEAVLLTRLSGLTSAAGSWTLPGGGVEHGEHPREAAAREVVEETGLDVVVGDLLDVDSVHFTGRSPTGVLEDYHAVRLVFAGTTTDERQPAVVELDGSSDGAAWVEESEIVSGAVPVVALVRFALDLTVR